MTRLFLETVKSRQLEHENQLKDGILNCRSVADMDLHIISQIKGQIYSYVEILDLENFLDMNALDDEEAPIDEREDIGT